MAQEVGEQPTATAIRDLENPFPYLQLRPRLLLRLRCLRKAFESL